MEGGPWTFDSHMLLLHRLQPRDVPKQIQLFYVDLWVHVHDLLIGFMALTLKSYLRRREEKP